MKGRVDRIRDELLARHTELRAAVDDIRRAVDRVRHGRSKPDVLRLSLGQLADTLRRHRAHEDDVLRDILRTVDAWGDVRADLLDEEHDIETRDLDEALGATGSTDDVERTLSITLDCVDRLLQHMAREERYVIAADVLCDDIVARNSFVG